MWQTSTSASALVSWFRMGSWDLILTTRKFDLHRNLAEWMQIVAICDVTKGKVFQSYIWVELS